MGTTVIIFGQSLSAALFIAVAQPVFESKLRSYLIFQASGLNPDNVIHAGAAALQSVASPEQLPLLRNAYNYACTHVFVSSYSVRLI